MVGSFGWVGWVVRVCWVRLVSWVGGEAFWSHRLGWQGLREVRFPNYVSDRDAKMCVSAQVCSPNLPAPAKTGRTRQISQTHRQADVSFVLEAEESKLPRCGLRGEGCWQARPPRCVDVNPLGKICQVATAKARPDLSSQANLCGH